MQTREDLQEKIKDEAKNNHVGGTQIAILMTIFELLADIREILTEKKHE